MNDLRSKAVERETCVTQCFRGRRVIKSKDCEKHVVTIDGRMSAVERDKAKFGTRFIVLPNPMYGNWEDAIYDNNPQLSRMRPNRLRRKSVGQSVNQPAVDQNMLSGCEQAGTTLR